MWSIFRLSVMVFCLTALTVTAEHDTSIQIIAGAETHGMIEACDCYQDPGGGLLKRSTVIKSTGKRDSFLLLDAGGFSAGGIYDSYSEGRAGDSLRTIITIRGMVAIGYDAAAIGDEELQYGGAWIVKQAKAAGLPLVSANLFTKKGKPLASTYVLVKKGGKTFAVTGLTTNEKLFSTDTTVTVGDPFKSLSRIWQEIVECSDYQIILSHLGQEKSEALADSFPECDIIVNGHRKSDQNPVLLTGKTPVMQFGFQGKSLSFAEWDLREGKLEINRKKWLHVGLQVPDDSSIVSFLKAEKVESRPVYDLYIMSQCPYGIQALSSFVEFVKVFKKNDWNIQFIGSVENDTALSSLHGKEEVEDEQIWLAVKHNYPERWLEFLELRSKSFVPTASILQKMKIDMEKIQKWINLKGRLELTFHYQRSSRLNIKASPTLMLNNTPLEMQITRDRLAKFHCDKIDGSYAECRKLPECFEDSDCKKKGKIGRCNENKKCVFQDAVPFTFTVLVADSTFQHPEKTIIATTEELFPGVKVNVVTLGSADGKQIISKFNPDALPFYLFSREVKQAYNFTSVESGLIEKNGSLIFKDGIVSRNYLIKRSPKKGEMTLFIDPFFPQIQLILDSFLSDTTILQNSQILPAFFHDPSTSMRGTEQWFRIEEAARWLAVAKFDAQKYLHYLKEYAKSPGSSFWLEICSKAGLDADSVSIHASSEMNQIGKHWNLLKNIQINEPVTLLVDNKELVKLHSEKELETFLQNRKKLSF